MATTQIKWPNVVLGGLVSAATIYFLISLGSSDRYFTAIKGVNYIALWPLVLIVPAVQLMRSYRLKLFLDDEFDWFPAPIYRLTSIHMLLSSILPSRTGELSLPIFLRTYYKLDFVTGTGILLAVRVYDLISLLVIVSGTIFVAFLNGTFGFAWGVSAGAGFVGLCGVGIVGPRAAVKVARFAQAWAPKKFAPHVDRLFHGASRVVEVKKIIGLVLTSLVIWALMNIGFLVSLNSVTQSGSLQIAILAGGAASLAVAQPINGIAGLGVVQAAWAGAASWLGLDWDSAVASGIVVHVVQIAAVACNALFAYLLIPPISLDPRETADTAG